MAITSTLSSDRFSMFVEQKIIKLVRDTGVLFSLEGLSIGYPSLTAASLDSTIPAKPIPVLLKAENVSIQPDYLSLLGSAHHLSLQGTLYDGTLRGDFQFSPALGSLHLNANIEGLTLQEHPQIAGFGINAGKLNATAKDLTISEKDTPLGALSLQVKGLSTISETTLPARLTGLPLPLVIPQVKNATISSQVHMKPDRVAVSALTFKSSWGSMSGSGNVALNADRRVRAFSFLMDVELSAQGQKHFGSYLPLITGNSVKSDQKKFSLTLAGFPFKVIAK